MNLLETIELQSLGDLECVIEKKNGKFFVKSHDRSKNLGGPYKSKEEAQKRLQQVEWFKRVKACKDC